MDEILMDLYKALDELQIAYDRYDENLSDAIYEVKHALSIVEGQEALLQKQTYNLEFEMHPSDAELYIVYVKSPKNTTIGTAFFYYWDNDFTITSYVSLTKNMFYSLLTDYVKDHSEELITIRLKEIQKQYKVRQNALRNIIELAAKHGITEDDLKLFYEEWRK